MDIVIDFDGTVVTHEFPEIGKDIGAEMVLKELIANGHRLILFTMRSDFATPVPGKPGLMEIKRYHLTEAAQWFHKRGIKLYGIQKNRSQFTWTDSPKAYGKIIIDDAALGCPLTFDPKLSNRAFVDWTEVRKWFIARKLIRMHPGSAPLFKF